MRKGQNPAKFVKQVAQPQRITVAVLNYIPFLSGFYAQTLEVLKTNLGSIWQNSDLPYDLMVFDNGSCQEAIDFLTEAQDEGLIQYLILSEKNMGKGGAWNVMLNAAPGEIIAYTDNDAYFYPGWLSKSVQILETFPKVGMVTSRPFRTPPEFYSQTVSWAENTLGVRLERGQFIPWEAFRAFDMSLGTPEDEVRKRYDETEDVRLTYQGLTAQAGASHWQFVAYKSVLQQFLPFSMDRPMGQVRQLDQRMNEAGYLRLMPVELLAQNMSNRLDWIHDPAEGGKSGPEAQGRPKTRRIMAIRKRLLNIHHIKRLLLGLYDRIFRWYYEN
ncbi:MAG TPA: glycosyltransferase family A protein [Anaerolineales bacterium]|nr:glycosyltransferase family A protein [Anaerolineales bacterium]